MSDTFMTTEEVAHALRAPVETVRYWRHVGQGPKSFKIGRRVLYAADDIERFIESARSEGHRPAQIPLPHVRLGRPEPKTNGARAHGSLTCPHCGCGIELKVEADNG